MNTDEEEQFGILENSFVETDAHSIGGTWFFNKGSYFGLSYSSYNSLYGVPGRMRMAMSMVTSMAMSMVTSMAMSMVTSMVTSMAMSMVTSMAMSMAMSMVMSMVTKKALLSWTLKEYAMMLNLS